jgi:hypothetical protein
LSSYDCAGTACTGSTSGIVMWFVQASYVNTKCCQLGLL